MAESTSKTSFKDWLFHQPEPLADRKPQIDEFPERAIPRHSLQTRITHDIVAVCCIWLAFSGLFVFVPQLAAAFPEATRVMRVSHRVMGAIFILAPIISAILAPKGFKAFWAKYFVKWTPEDKEFMKKFVPYMLAAKKVHMPDQDEVKSGQRFADGLMILAGIFIAISGVTLWLGMSVFQASNDTIQVMRTIHDICFIVFIVFGLAHIYLGAGIYQPYKGTGRLMWGDGEVNESDALYHWGFWTREQIEKGNVVPDSKAPDNGDVASCPAAATANASASTKKGE